MPRGSVPWGGRAVKAFKEAPIYVGGCGGGVGHVSAGCRMKVINAVHRFASFPGSDQESYGMRRGEGLLVA